jgi:hypothetical protein
MEKHKQLGQNTLKGIMLIVVLFLIADIVVFALMFFNVNLNTIVEKFTENTVFNNLDVKTDNSTLVTVTLTKATDNIGK